MKFKYIPKYQIKDFLKYFFEPLTNIVMGLNIANKNKEKEMEVLTNN